MMNIESVWFLVMMWLVERGNGRACIDRHFGSDVNIVCVCNSTYCDSLATEVTPKGTYMGYTTTKSGQRLEPLKADRLFHQGDNGNGIRLNVRPSIKYQTIHGFGGAFTDAAGLNMRFLSNGTQEQLMQAYFGENGSRYSLGRLPIGGSDFSTRPYTLDDVANDVDLKKFSLTKEDEVYKIPYMKRALELNPQLRFIAAAWTGPPWMKTDGKYTGAFGALKEQYYQTYADYLVKFLENYQQRGLPMWAISTGNEPSNALSDEVKFNDMYWTPDTQSRFVVDNLNPTIRKSTVNNTKILVLDDQRSELSWWMEGMYGAEGNVGDYFDGIAVHWYDDAFTSPLVFDFIHKRYPEKFMIMTEACIERLQPSVQLGDWSRAEKYIHSIIQDINHWMTGWVDWNLALDNTGGPNWVNNNVDAPIIVNPDDDEFYKQPMYYAIAHVSKFVPPNSSRIYITQNPRIESTAFLTPDNDIVIVLYNPKNIPRNLDIIDDEQGTISFELPANSIRTIYYKRQ